MLILSVPELRLPAVVIKPASARETSGQFQKSIFWALHTPSPPPPEILIPFV